MEIVAVLRVLRRHRLLVAAGALPALLVALSLQFQLSLMPPGLASKERQYGVATSRVLLSAPAAPAFDLDSEITDTLGVRARLLADLMATDDVRAKIAARAGVEADQLAVMGPAMGPPKVLVPLAVSATEASVSAREPYVVLVSVQEQVPIISLRGAAPDEAAAARVVDATAKSLEQLISDRSAGGSALRVEALGPAAGRTIVEGAKPVAAVIAAILVFALWAAAVVVVSGLARYWRASHPRRRAPRFAPSA